MRIFNQYLAWSPSTVSVASFVFMVLIVAAIGFSGTAHVVNYLHERLMIHGIDHDQEIASSLVPTLKSVAGSNSDDIQSLFLEKIKTHLTPGIRIFLLDRVSQSVIDSKNPYASSLPLEKSWLTTTSRFDGASIDLLKESGPMRATNESQHLMLIWMQEIEQPGQNRWVLGVANDQKMLTEFMGDLNLHMDAVLFLTYILITVFGYLAMRGIGRHYERSLETQVAERTRALETAHEDILLKTRLATIGQTASVLTHEMRNPLASIKLALSGLRGADIGDRELRRVELVLGEVDRLDLLLAETLDYVRPVRLSSTPVYLEQLLSKVIKQEQPLIEQRQIQFDYGICANCMALRVDEAQIHQVFLNLIKNAVEASPEGGVIKIRTRQGKDTQTVEITNSGDPMSEDILHKAFELFFTTKPKGTGLGLGLVKRVIEEHGGRVDLVSNEQTGTRVTLAFPAISSTANQ
jgi:signal transduction histidine kinase